MNDWAVGTLPPDQARHCLFWLKGNRREGREPTPKLHFLGVSPADRGVAGWWSVAGWWRFRRLMECRLASAITFPIVPPSSLLHHLAAAGGGGRLLLVPVQAAGRHPGSLHPCPARHSAHCLPPPRAGQVGSAGGLGTWIVAKVEQGCPLANKFPTRLFLEAHHPHANPSVGAWTLRPRHTSTSRAWSFSSLHSAGSTASCCGSSPSSLESGFGTRTWLRGEERGWSKGWGWGMRNE